MENLVQGASRFAREWPDCNSRFASEYSFYVFKNEQLLCWTDNKVIPPVNRLHDTTSVQLLKIARSDFLLYQQPMENGYQLVSLLTLARNYPIQNNYLSIEWNKQLFPTGNITVLEPSSNKGIPVEFRGEIIFRVNFILSDLSSHPIAASWSVLFSSLGIVFFIAGFYRWTLTRYNRTKSTLFICLLLITVRLMLLLLSFPRLLFPGFLFSPQQFASSILNPSLGDLWLNTFTLFIVSLFIFNGYRSALTNLMERKNRIVKIVMSIVSGFLIFCAVHYPIITFQTIAHNSTIDFDITSSLEFSWIRFVAISAVLLTWCTSFLFLHIFSKLIFSKHVLQTYAFIIAGGILFAALNLWQGQRYLPTLLTTAVLTTLTFYFQLLNNLDRLQYKTFIYFFIVLFAFVLNSTVSIYFLSKEKNIANQLRFADSFLTERDAFGEFLLNDLSENIRNDVFIKTRLSSPFLSKEPIQQKIRQVYLPNYFNKYDINILLFNSQGYNVVGSLPNNFSEFLKTYESEANRTEYSGLFHLTSIRDNVTRKYVLVNAIKRNSVRNGYIVVELSLKKSVPENVYPELLVDNRFRESLRPDDISYAMFVSNKLASQAGEFEYTTFDSTLLQSSEIFENGIEEKGYQHIAIKNGDNAVTIISAESISSTFLLANFSFYLILGLTIVVIFVLTIGLINIFHNRPLYYAARIQLFINISFFIPLLIVSVVTLSMLSRSSQEQLNETYQGKAVFLAEQLSGMQQKDSINKRYTIKESVLELSRVANTEIALFNYSGNLIAGSQPLIFESQLMARIINPEAFEKMKHKETEFIVTDKVGKLPYFVAYAKVPDSNNLLAVPYYQSGKVLEKVQIKALADILIIFGVIFLALSFISYVISQWLTFPLAFITKSLQQTFLNRANKPLEWKANDEIGLMVNAYNDMLQKLTESKQTLERMQREEAWREIAQQVAHEIKNPLTPMKLSLQKLGRNVQEDSLDRNQTKKAIDSMLEQVEALNAIATSFNSFAKLPTALLQTLDVVPLLKRMVELYGEDENIVLKAMPGQLWVIGDTKLVSGIFANIILNAIQAKREELKVQIKISAAQSGDYWQIRITDNGKGIDPEEIDKIFLPHFTTKQSGSGLGLAIAKQSIEQLHGKIWFETDLSTGTTFVIEIPKAGS